jgi:PAS domain S-box-containing protein
VLLSEAGIAMVLTAALLLCAAAAAFAAAMNRQTRRRIERLAEAARRIGTGDASFALALADSRHDAIGELTETFREMAVTIADRETQLRSADERARLLIESAASAIVTFDAGGRIETINRAATKLLGYAPRELTGRELSLLLSDYIAPPPGWDDGSAHASEADSEFGGAVETNVRQKDGTLIPIHLSTAAVRFGGRRLFIAVMTDITEIKKAAQAKDNFVSVVSHELRTPLTAIQGALALVRAEVTGELPQKTRAMIAIAHGNVERLLRIINDILDMEKIRAGKLDYDFRTVDLGSLLEQVVEANQIYAAQFDVNIMLAPVPPLAVRADAGRLTQALTNLLSNAIKASDNGGSVVMDTKAGRETVRVSITDRGPGIAPEIRGRIFDDFVQGEPPLGHEKSGSGLGLGIARSIIRDHGGKLDFVSQVGRGTTFFLDLPLAVDVVAVPIAESAAAGG